MLRLLDILYYIHIAWSRLWLPISVADTYTQQEFVAIT